MTIRFARSRDVAQQSGGGIVAVETDDRFAGKIGERETCDLVAGFTDRPKLAGRQEYVARLTRYGKPEPEKDGEPKGSQTRTSW